MLAGFARRYGARPPASCLLAGLIWLCSVILGGAAVAYNASLDRPTTTVGESVTLSLTFEGGSPASAPAVPAIPGLTIQYAGQEQQMTFINGQSSSRVNHKYMLTPTQAGVYTIPPIPALVNGQLMQCQPLKLTVLKSAEPDGTTHAAPKLAFLKLVVPKTEIYLGEILPVETGLYWNQYVQIQNPQVAPLRAEGFTMGKAAKPEQTQTRMGNQIYNVGFFKMSVAAAKTGTLTLGPAECGLTLLIPQNRGQRWDPFDVFGRFERRSMTLASEPQTLRVLPLPAQGMPAGFNGAVGSYTLSVNASPTQVAVGDPVTVKIRIAGRGNLDALASPLPSDWPGFKTYPPTSKLETPDPLGLEGVKTFECIVTPQSPEVKALPPLSFSFFDPERKTYQTLQQPAIVLAVRPAAAGLLPAAVAANPSAGRENSPPPMDIINIKTHLGVISEIQPPLAQQPWFLALQSIPLVALLTAVIRRQSRERLIRNPRLRRQREVARVVHTGLKELRHLAETNQAEAFYATAFRLLQEQLGERLDLPASAITEAVLEDHLRPWGASERILTELHDLFRTCNQARYAPPQAAEGLFFQFPKVESALRALREIELI